MDTSKQGMARYLAAAAPSAQQGHERQQADAGQEREKAGPVTNIGTAESNALTATLRDPAKRKAHLEAQSRERQQRLAAAEQRTREAMTEEKTLTEVADPAARGMARYLPER